MNLARLVWSDMRFHWRTNLGVVLGAAVAAAVLIGALLVGDSIRSTLARMTGDRLGAADFVAAAEDRLFGADVADRLHAESGLPCAAVLLLSGVALSPEGDRRVNDVQIVGVDAAFWALAPGSGAPTALPPGTCRVNATLAAALGLGPDGGAVVLRAQKPGGLPLDMRLTARGEGVWSRHLRVTGVQDADAFGAFSLQATQQAVPTVFVALDWLGEALEQPGRANVLLLPNAGDAADPEAVARIWQARLDAVWTPADAGLTVETVANGVVELRSERVFLSPGVAAAARGVHPEIQPIVTYFINRVDAPSGTAAHAFVTAPGPPRVPEAFPDDAVLINDWLAADLGAGTGVVLRLAWHAVDRGGRLETQSTALTVAGILETEAVAADDRGLVPAIPGLTDVGNCRDWNPGIPVDLDRITDRDEAYWAAYGPAPKLYVSRAAAETLWANKFGVWTAVRFPAGAGGAAQVEAALRERLTARDGGLVVRAARAEGLAAGRDGVDFGELFVGLSLFLIASAILLTVLVFVFNVGQRRSETGILLAIGFQPRTVIVLRVAEGAALVVIGAVLGAGLAVGYQALILRALGSVWRDAVLTSTFDLAIRPRSLALGAGVVVVSALLGMAWAMRGQARVCIRALQPVAPVGGGVGRMRRSGLSGLVLLLLAAGLAAVAPAGREGAAVGVFFGSGLLVLLGLFAWIDALGAWVAGLEGRLASGAVVLAVRGATVRRGRSLASIVLVALGVFLVVAVAANRRGILPDPMRRASGTGGYAIWGRTTLPVTEDLNRDAGRVAYGLPAEWGDRVRFIQLPMRPGDEASCLNLHRVAAPHVLGVDPAEWDARGAFAFAAAIDAVDRTRPWRVLERDFGPDIVPGIANLGDIVWSLGKAVGDLVPAVDEAGRPFAIKLVAGLSPSVLQGHVLISAAAFAARFPSVGGTRVILADVSAGLDPDDVLGRLTHRLSDAGFAGARTPDRLASFSRVENTYLSIFMILGGLGVLLGSAGLGVVAARNILERRGELALLRAVGYRRGRVRALVFFEHAVLAVAGVVTGVLAACVAVSPALRAADGAVPWRGLVLTLALVTAGCLLWIGAAVWFATRGPLLAALRSE